jgi:putative ABC transport system permease protein
MNPPPDFRGEVRRRGSSTGTDLPDAMVEELAQHLEDLYEAALAAGAPPGAAAQQARRALDGSSVTPLVPHAARIAPPQSLAAMTALRAALRQFRHHPAFALIVVIVLGLSVGAAATVFSIVDTVVLRPLPYRAPDRLVTIWDTNAEKGLSHDPISPVTFMDQRGLPVFSDAAAWWRPGVNLTDPGLDPLRVQTIETSGNLFDVLGVGPQLGAGFPSGGPLFVQKELITVISDRLWRTRYGADPSIIGRQLLFNGTPYTVVGVMPPKFHYPDDIDVWQRLQWDMTQHSRAAHFMEAVARLADGATIQQAQAAIESLGSRLQVDESRTNAGWNSRVIALLEDALGYYRPALMVLFGAVGLLLVIGIFNVASLLLTRALSRDREMAVRMAMGASPRQIVTQLFLESLALSVAGAMAGIVASLAVLPLVVALTPVEVPRLADAAVSWRAVAAAGGVVAATTLLFGLIPALLLLRTQLGTQLRSGERGSSRSARRIYSALVAGEVALACALLVASALLIRTVGGMMSTPIGVAADDTLVTTVQLTQLRGGGGTDVASLLKRWQQVADQHAQILDRLRNQPGVASAGAANFLPLDAGWRNPFTIDGEAMPARREDLPQAQMHTISEGYLETMGARLVHGRAFSSFDTTDATGVVIVNEAFASRFLGGRLDGRALRVWATSIGPLGVNLKANPADVHSGVVFEIVGVVGDIANVGLGQPVEPAIYFPARQFPFSEQFIVVKASDAGTGLAAIRAALRDVAPNVPMANVDSWGRRFERRSAVARMLMSVLLAFGGLAGLLAAIGVYGLFSWSVALRRRELAIRLTLGASPGGVGGLVVRQGALLVTIGLIAGWVIVRLAASALTRVLFGVTASDLTATFVASAVLLLATLAACLPAAARAMRVDPVEGLRAE